MAINLRHLHYFWMAARSGGIARASEQLHTTPQTLSGQIKVLEERVGRKLFRRAGRQLELTDDGRLALGYADEIFTLGAELEAALRQPHGAPRALEFHVGVVDSVPKSLAYRLLEPALGVTEPVRLIAHEGKYADLLSQLAVQRLDLVIADAPLPRSMNVKAFNHELGSTPTAFFASPSLRATLAGRFPRCLDAAPMLLPGATSAIRAPLESWLAREQIRPRIVGEFDDGALMKAFGRQGRGVFVAPAVLRDELQAQFGVTVIGSATDLIEEFYAVSAQRRITHPCVAAITTTARERLFGR